MQVKNKYAKVVKEWQAKNYDKALKLLYKMRAREGDFYYIEAHLYFELDNYVKAYPVFKKLCSMMPHNSPEYLKQLALLASCYSQLGIVDESLKLYQHIMETTNDRKMFYQTITNMLFDINIKVDATAADFHALYERYRNSFTFEPYPRRFYKHDKIRLGFLSGDFRNHVVMKWTWPLLTEIDRNQFELYYYSNTKEEDEITDYLRQNANGWRDILKVSDEDAAKLIYDDEIDILIDLSGRTSWGRANILAYRPATVQVGAIGFTDSSGLNTVDYFLTDVHCLGNSAAYFTEKFIVMTKSCFCFNPFGVINIPPVLEPPCLKNRYVTFGSFNQYKKLTDLTLTAWKKIMDAVPDSRLLLKHKTYGLEGGREFVRSRLKRLGFDVNRVELRGHTKKHPLDYNDVDIALDTFPYTGATTTAEAIYMGVPVVSFYGDRHANRCGLSILNNAGLPELAVDNYDDYIKRAVALANDWELITILHKNLRTMMEKSPLMDPKGYVREIEQAFINVLNDARNAQ